MSEGQGGGNSRRRAALGIVAAAAVLVAGSTFFYWRWRQTHVTTDDAFVEGRIHTVSSRVQGTVARVLVRDNQAVRPGDPLVEIDTEPYDVREAIAAANLAAARSDLKGAEGDHAASRAELARMRSAVEAARAKVSLATARLEQAVRDAERAGSLFGQNMVSREEHERAGTDAQVARAAADLAREELSLAKAAIPVQEALVARNEARIEQQKALVDQREAQLSAARLDKRYTAVTSPAEGFVTRKRVEVGQVAAVGQPLLAIASISEVWIVANFKETQVGRIRPGQSAVVRADTFPGTEFRGRVESLMAGTGSAFAIFPTENATGNYVKVVQRLPVKIVLEDGPDPDHVLRIGMSVVPTVLVR